MVFAANVVASFFGSFEPCGPQPPAAEARKRAPQAATESKPFVILNEVKNLLLLLQILRRSMTSSE